MSGINILSALQVQKSKPQEKDYRLYDGGGVSLLVKTTGAKWWRFSFTFDSVRKELSLGVYPAVTLADARGKRESYRKLVAAGVNPSTHRQAQRSGHVLSLPDSFEIIAREWHASRKESITADHHANLMTRLEKDIFPWVGSLPIHDISAMMVKGILDRVKARGVVETARRCRVIMSQVFQYAVTTDRATIDPAAALKSYLPSVSSTRRHFSAVTEPKELAPLLRAIAGYQGGDVTRCALAVLPMLLVRPGELRHARWADIDLDGALWSIPAPQMKMKEPHMVPLSRQVVEILKGLKPSTRGSIYCFPSTRSVTSCMSDNTINAAFRRMGFEKEIVTGHGFRATARTILDEVLGVRVEHIEHQLSHVVRDPLGRAYNRTAHLEARRVMMQQWADYLQELATAAS